MKQSIIDKRNQYVIEGKTCHLTICKKDGRSATYSFDADKIDEVKRHVWHVHLCHGGNYAGAWNHQKHEHVHLHRLLSNCPPDKKCYFADRQATNCTSDNLRIGNMMDVCGNQKRLSKSGHRNIYEKKGKWQVWIATKWIGERKTLEDAIELRDRYLDEKAQQQLREQH